MKNTVLTLIVIAVVAVGAWYLLGNGKMMLPKNIGNYPVTNNLATSPTPSLAPKDDIDQEVKQTDQDLNKTNPNDFSADAITNVKLGL